MTYTFNPTGVCSKRYTIDVEDGIIKNIEIEGGCSGNLAGISSILRGMEIDHVIERFEGVRCGFRPTSCPDQIARALKAIKEAN